MKERGNDKEMPKWARLVSEIKINKHNIVSHNQSLYFYKENTEN